MLDGQTLASDIHVFLRLVKLSGTRSLTDGGGDPARIRVERRFEAAVAAGPSIPMARVEELEMPGPAGAMRARLYTPAGENRAANPLLVYYHGGGWVIGDLDTHDGVCRFLAAHSGVKVLSIDYRLAPEHPFPEPLEDAHAAFDWAVAHASELGADSARIAVGGDSAGGNMATVVCQMARAGGGPRPSMQLLIYPADRRDRDLALARAVFGGIPAHSRRHGLVSGKLPAKPSRRRRPAGVGVQGRGSLRPAASLRADRRL